MASKTEILSQTVQAIEAALAAGELSKTAVENLTRWLSLPQYAGYQPTLQAMIAEARFAELETAFWEVIPFGTGGRRGLMGRLGSATINDRTIAESAHGLASYLKQQTGALGGRAVVACDTRNRSLEFAKLTATTFAAHGLKVFYFESHRSTPELSFAVRHLNCDIGVMISASHNPPSDNGFKAYWSHGGQVLAPHDAGIIDRVYDAGEIPAVDYDEAVADGRVEVVGADLDRAYIESVLAMSLSEARGVSAIFSPLHGVGETSVFEVLREAGFGGVELFEPHRRPDGNFTNVPDQLPNPERSEVFEPMVTRAQETGASLVLASDPDADRLGVSVKNREGRFVHLSGNQVGALLTDYIIRKREAAGTLSPEHYIVLTLVTTPLMVAIARARGIRAIDNLLVGFKYIGETVDREGPENFVFGAEESLGYLAGVYARDKDAAVAALYTSELASELANQDKTLLDRLDELYAEHGYFVEGQLSKVCKGSEGKQQIDRLMQTFRASPPAELAGISLAQVRDFQQHEIRSLPENKPTDDLPAPAGNLLFFESTSRDLQFSLAVRPSGTEPKIKFYFFARADVGDPSALAERKAHTDSMFQNVQNALSGWVEGVLGTDE